MAGSAYAVLPTRSDARLHPPGRTGERTMAMAIAAAFVIVRTLVFLRYEQLYFDSDQAIIGLMAKHLIEGRAFPLFFYGQAYMLGVEAWLAAPFFLVGGATVTVLRTSMLAWNLAFVVLLLLGLERAGGLRPWMALVPALFFAAAPPSMARQLVQAQGGIIEPFVYVALLWFLRRRPAWFGIVLGIGFLNREFTLYAVPVLFLLEWSTHVLTARRVREWLLALVAFFAVWESVDVLKRFADLGGPGTRGELLGGFSGSQVSNLLNRFNWQAGSVLERVARLGPDILGWFGGARQIETDFPVPDRRWLTWVLVVAGALAMLRVVILLAHGAPQTTGQSSRLGDIQDRLNRSGFALYLLGVGIVATAVFVAGRPVLAGYARYVTLGLLAPVGLTAALLALEWRPRLRHLTVIFVIAWASTMLVDHTRVLVAYRRAPPPAPARQVADRLVAEGVKVAAAGYWQAYEITFLARECVKVASTNFVRIQEYQRLAAEDPAAVVRISTAGCPGGKRVATFYLCKAGN